MSDLNNTDSSIESRLGEYGAVLRAELDGGATSSDEPTGMFLVGATATPPPAKRSTTGPLAAILSVAAAVLLLVGVVVPGLADKSKDSITITGIAAASQPQDAQGPDGPGGDASEKGEPAEQGDGTQPPTADVAADDKMADVETKDAKADAATTHDDQDDWSQFGVQTSKGDASESVELATTAEPSQDDAAQAAEDEEKRLLAAAAGADEDGADEDKADEDKADEDKADEDKADKADEDKTQTSDAEESSDDEIEECPTGAVVFADECYEVVPPSCGELEAAPQGDGCLKLVGTPSGQSGCSGAYERDGDICIKHLTASVSCSQGVPADGACLIKEDAIGGEKGCANGHLEIGGSCYELSPPSSFSCGDLSSLPDGQCRWPVSGESGTSCPSGFEPLGANNCYRYEDPPTYSCAEGVADGEWCKISESGTPGDDVCDDGVLQDASGCYIIVDRQEDGTCGEATDVNGECRKSKPSYPTWTCSNGETVYEDACFVWTEAVASCAAGEPIDGGAKCKTIVDAEATSGCPNDAFEDASGCYKTKPATASCGDLHVAPDGENCKEWVGEASGSGAECPAGFELVGSYCKKYVDGTASCADAVLVEVAGKAMCRYTKPAGESTVGCGAGELEKDGNCYLVVAPSCQELDVDIFGNGCKKPIKNS